MAQTFETIMKYPAADEKLAGKALEAAAGIAREDLARLLSVLQQYQRFL